MRLQLAIDTLESAEAERLVARVRDLVDIVEVGTPLIIREGVAAVRRLHAAFPELDLVADLKIADGGHLEASLGFAAGARMVTVLASAADATIREALRAAREHRGEVVVDLMGVANPVRRAREVEALGVHIVCLHTAVDVQKESAGAAVLGTEALRVVMEALSTARTAVAGGITAETCGVLAALRPDIVIVGSGITGAADPRAAAAAVRAAVQEGRPCP